MIPPQTHRRWTLLLALSVIVAAGTAQCASLYVSAVDLVPTSDSGPSIDVPDVPVDVGGGSSSGGGSSTFDGGSGGSGSSGGSSTGSTNPDGAPSPPIGAVPCGVGGTFCYAPTMTCCTVSGMSTRMGGGRSTSTCAASPSACPAGTTTTASCAGAATCGGGQMCCFVGSGGRGGFGGAAGGAGACQAPAVTGGCATGDRVCTPSSGDCTPAETCQPAFFGGGGGGIMTCQSPGCTAVGGTSPCASGQVCCVAGGATRCQMGTTCTTGAQACSTTANCPMPLVCVMGGGGFFGAGGGGTATCEMPLGDAGGGG